MTSLLTAFPAEYDADIQTRVFDAIGQQPMIWRQYNNVSGTDKYIESLTSYSGFGAAGQWYDGEDLPMDEALKLGDQTMTQVFYGMGFSVSRQLVKYGNLATVQAWAAALGKSVGQTMALTHANTLNNAFSTTFSHFGTKALCSTSHTTSGAGTRSNRLATNGALTPANWEATILLGANWVNYRGLNDPFVVDKMIVPPALRMIARKIQASEQEPDTTDNDINVHKGSFGLVVDPLLSSTSAFFGQAQGHGLVSIHGQLPRQIRYVDDPSQSLVHGIANDFVNSVRHPDGSVGSSGA